MLVLIADKFEQSGREGLESIGCDYEYQPDAKDDSLVEAIAHFRPDVLVVRSTKVTEPMFDAGPLKLVVRAGAGYNTIDVAAASRRGVYVSNCPGKNSVAVAELAFALMLALDRRIAENVSELRAGRWNKKEFSKARGLLGRTLGLVGTGQIGREVITRARAFGMNVVAWSRSLTDESAAELAVAAGEFGDDIAREPNLYGTHHIGASTDQAQEAIAAETVRVIRTFKETGRVPNVVNLARRTPSTHTLVVRHRDRPGVLASVLDRVRAESINVQEMENVIFEGSEAAVARINLEAALPAQVLERLKADNADIIELSLLE